MFLIVPTVGGLLAGATVCADASAHVGCITAGHRASRKYAQPARPKVRRIRRLNMFTQTFLQKCPKFRPSLGMHQVSGVNSHPDGSESVALKLRREARDEALHLFSAAVPVLNCLTFGKRCRRQPRPSTFKPRSERRLDFRELEIRIDAIRRELFPGHDDVMQLHVAPK